MLSNSFFLLSGGWFRSCQGIRVGGDSRDNNDAIACKRSTLRSGICLLSSPTYSLDGSEAALKRKRKRRTNAISSEIFLCICFYFFFFFLVAANGSSIFSWSCKIKKKRKWHFSLFLTLDRQYELFDEGLSSPRAQGQVLKLKKEKWRAIIQSWRSWNLSFDRVL